jgi:hypothetical protein
MRTSAPTPGCGSSWRSRLRIAGQTAEDHGRYPLAARMAEPMTIACLGWGSLIWDPRDLPLGSAWREDGPQLPVEFARQSCDGRITLVIVDDCPPSSVLWAELRVKGLAEAIRALARRENVGSNVVIGRWPANGGRAYPHRDAIAAWAKQRNLSGVVWTALKPGLSDRRGTVPSLADIVQHLQGFERSTTRGCNTLCL